MLSWLVFWKPFLFGMIAGVILAYILFDLVIGR